MVYNKIKISQNAKAKWIRYDMIRFGKHKQTKFYVWADLNDLCP